MKTRAFVDVRVWGWKICSCFFDFFLDFLSYGGIYLARGHFDPPNVGRLNVGFFPLNPTYLGLFECFSTITRQLKDNAVKQGFLENHKSFLKHRYIK